MAKAVVVKQLSKKFIKPDFQTHSASMATVRKSVYGFNPSWELSSLTVLEDISFSLQESAILGIYGGAGSGKSTLLRILSGQLLPDEGDVYIFGKDLIQKPLQAMSLMNRMSVDASFYKRLSPLENLSLTFPHSQSKGMILSRSMQLLMELGLEEWMIFCPMEDLEKGIQQVVGLAAAILANTRLLLLDEPTQGMDIDRRSNVYQMLHTLHCNFGTTVIFSSQDLGEVESLSDYAIKLEGGHAYPMISDWNEQEIQGFESWLPTGSSCVEKTGIGD